MRQPSPRFLRRLVWCAFTILLVACGEVDDGRSGYTAGDEPSHEPITDEVMERFLAARALIEKAPPDDDDATRAALEAHDLDPLRYARLEAYARQLVKLGSYEAVVAHVEVQVDQAKRRLDALVEDIESSEGARRARFEQGRARLEQAHETLVASRERLREREADWRVLERWRPRLEAAGLGP